MALINRMQGDQVKNPEILHEFDGRPAEILARYIRMDLKRKREIRSK